MHCTFRRVRVRSTRIFAPSPDEIAGEILFSKTTEKHSFPIDFWNKKRYNERGWKSHPHIGKAIL